MTERPEPAPPRPTASDTLQQEDAGGVSEPFTGTVGTTEQRFAGQDAALLLDVRTGMHPGFDRIVFVFAGETLPGYALEYVDRPVRNCGEGRVVPVAGEAWLRIRLTPARAHTDAGQPTVAPRERRPALPVLREAEMTCDFEAEVAWVLGLAAPNPYRVRELRRPTRLIVDVRH